MGAPTKGTSATLSRHTGSGGVLVDSGQGKTTASKQQVVGKLQRTRRNRRRVKEYPCPKQHHKQYHRLLAPVPASPFNDSATCRRGDSLYQQTPPLPSLIRRNRPPDDSDMLRTRQSLASGLGAPPTGGIHPTSPRSSKVCHDDGILSESLGGPSPVLTAAGRPHSENNNNSSNDRHVHDQEQEAMRKGLEELLARPPPSFDYVATEDDEGDCRQGSLLQRGGGDAASRSLPELFLSRAGNRGNVDNSNAGGKPGQHKERRRGSRSSNSSSVASTLTSTKDKRRAKKPTRSQSGGLLRPAPSLAVGSTAAFGHRDSAASAGAGRTQGTTTIAASFTGKDAVLLEQAFAFAERVATEEEGEEETMGRQAPLGSEGRRRPGRDRRGPAAGLPLREDRHHRERFTRSSGASVMSGGSGGNTSRGSISGAGRIEVEDWVRGLQGPSSQKRQPTSHQQSQRSINQAPSDGSGLASRGREGKIGGRRGITVTGSRKQQDAEPGALRFDRRRETRETKKMMATAELVERFAAGTGVAELRAELEASQASMKRSAEAIEQVASRGHQQRSLSTL